MVKRNGGMTTNQIADAINRQRLHIRKDGKPVTSAQVYAVICRLPEMFTKEAGRIMLMMYCFSLPCCKGTVHSLSLRTSSEHTPCSAPRISEVCTCSTLHFLRSSVHFYSICCVINSFNLSSRITFGCALPARTRIFFPFLYMCSCLLRTTAVKVSSSCMACHIG